MQRRYGCTKGLVVDLSARRAAAQLYRHFGAGLLTNDEMEDLRPSSVEQALELIWWNGVWPFYDDASTHRLTGKHRLMPAGRRQFARIVLFLRGDLPYRWPHNTGWRFAWESLLFVATLFFYRPWRGRWQNCGGDETVWPFFTRSEFEAALRHPPYLAGLSRA